ncbi:MAG: acyl-CoA dehydrogenase family protein [Acidimicrobiia bacterium]
MAEPLTFLRSDEQQMLGTALRDMLEATVDMDRTRELSLTGDAFDRPVWAGLRDMGLVGLTVDDSFGGAGSSISDLAVAFEELGRVVAAVPLLSTVMAMTLIEQLGSEAQKSALLPALVSGERIGTVGIYEAAHGSSGAGMQTVAEQTPTGWRLVGQKRWVTDLPNADVVLVVASVDDGLGVFVVDTDDDGCDRTLLSALDPTRPLGVCTLAVDLEEDARLGDEADEAVASVVDLAVTLMAAEQVGGAQRCLESAVDYASTRFQFGRAIGSFQAVKHKCADMLVAVEHARSVASHASATFATDESNVAVPLAKSVCTDAYLLAASENIQIHGGIGFTWEHDAHLYFKRAKADALLFGGVDHYRDRLGAAIGV